MHPFASYVLRSYNQATGWNEVSALGVCVVLGVGLIATSGAGQPLFELDQVVQRCGLLLTLRFRLSMMLIYYHCSDSGLYGSPRRPLLHLKVYKCTLQYELHHECPPDPHRVDWVHFHILRPRCKEFVECAV